MESIIVFYLISLPYFCYGAMRFGDMLVVNNDFIAAHATDIDHIAVGMYFIFTQYLGAFF
jgi:hypothetical protein